MAILPWGDWGRLARLAADLMDRYRPRERPTMADGAGVRPEPAPPSSEPSPESPHFAAERPAPADVSYKASEEAFVSPALGQLGDYCILRLVGGGGMGLVYEAIRETLRFQVALKVIHPRYRDSPAFVERFLNEARAAARLHHTNIVPVFDFGVEDGICFYAMTYIEGLGLDRVINALRTPRATTEADTTETFQSANSLLSSLSVAPDPNSAATVIFLDVPSTTDPLTLNALGHASGLTGPTGRFRGCAPREVARIGVQVADALDHAHARGVVHRDIKPSNLLLDARGNIWIADFGLASAADGEAPSSSPDFGGTIRYMAPERFDGRSDNRSDIYALGATLYELLTLKPAFTGGSTADLIERIRHEPPTRPREIDPSIPRDLEAVIRKALAKDPDERFATAGEMAAELRRVVEDVPIRSRRTPLTERAWRWCRRNPAVAGLAASVVLLLAVVATIATTAYFREVEHGRRIRDAVGALLVAQAEEDGPNPGRQLRGLEAVAGCVGIRPAAELRDAALACMARHDMRPAWRGAFTPPGTAGLGFDATFGRFARSDTEKGEIRVRRVDNDQELARLTGPDLPAWRLDFSPSGRHLAARHHPKNKQDETRLRVWDLERCELILDLPAGTAGAGLSWSPDGRRLAVTRNDGQIGLYEVETGRESRRLGQKGEWVTNAAFDPDGSRLAVSNGKLSSDKSAVVRIYDVKGGGATVEYEHSMSVGVLAWHPGGRFLATGGDDARVRLFDLEDHSERFVFSGHPRPVNGLAFHPGGDLMASTSWDGTLCLWDPWTATMQVRLASAWWAGPQFSRDGRFLAGTFDSESFRAWEIIPAKGVRTMPGHNGPSNGEGHLDLSPKGDLIVTTGEDGVRVWDVATCREVARLPVGVRAVALFEADGGAVLSANKAGLMRWPILSDSRTGIRFGRPEPFLPEFRSSTIRRIARGGGDRPLIVADRARGEAVLLDPTRSDRTLRLPGNPQIAQVALSPDGLWAATSTWHGEGVKVWDVCARRLVWRLDKGDARVAFSPDSRWLVTSTTDEYCFWEVDTWRPGPRIVRKQSGLAGPVAFSDDGSLLAISPEAGEVWLMSFDSTLVRPLATFRAPEGATITALRLGRDGSLLAALTDDHRLQLWDLREIRRSLATMKLDW